MSARTLVDAKAMLRESLATSMPPALSLGSAGALARPGVAGKSSKKDAWPSARSRCWRPPLSSAASVVARRCARVRPSESNAPALTRLSTTRRMRSRPAAAPVSASNVKFRGLR